MNLILFKVSFIASIYIPGKVITTWNYCCENFETSKLKISLHRYIADKISYIWRTFGFGLQLMRADMKYVTTFIVSHMELNKVFWRFIRTEIISVQSYQKFCIERCLTLSKLILNAVVNVKFCITFCRENSNI